MHRHSYHGRKFSRMRDQRRALVRGLATELVLREQITTTKPKAKEVIPFTEKLITKAKVGSLHARRQIQARLANEQATAKLIEDIAPRFKARHGGYVRIESAGWRQGDDAQLAKLSFTEKAPTKADKPEKKTPAKSKAVKQPAKAGTKS